MISCRAAATEFLIGVTSTHLLLRSIFKLSKFTLDVIEELLNRIEPRRVLGVQQDVGFEPPRRRVDGLVLVYARVVHQDDYFLLLGLSIDPKLVQHSVQEIVKDHRVGAAFGYLCANHTVRRHSCNHRE